MAHYQKALQIRPDYAEAHNNLANALLQKGKVDEAMVHYQKALQINPDYAEAHNNLGYVLFQKGSVDEAIVHFQKALQINPDYVEAHNNLGNALLQKGRVDEAIVHFQKALQIKPDSVDILNNLAWLLATSPDAHIRDGVQAVKYAERACELTHYGRPLSSAPWRPPMPRRDDLTMRLRRRRKPARWPRRRANGICLRKTRNCWLCIAPTNRFMRRLKSLFPSRRSLHALYRIEVP